MNEIWQKIKPKGDVIMWYIIIALMAIGLIAVYSSTGQLAYKGSGRKTEYFLMQQIVFLVASFGLLLWVHTIPYKVFMKLSKIALYISYILLVLTFFSSEEINLAKRWIKIPLIGLSIQTSEIAKVALMIFIARHLSIHQKDIKDFKKTIQPIAIHIFIKCALIAPNNLSTALVIFMSSLVILFIGRAKIMHVLYLAGGGAGIVILLLLLILILPANMQPKRGSTWLKRIQNFENPFSKSDYNAAMDAEKLYKPEQKDYAQFAIATGGFWGKGPGQSTERNFLPEAYNDFIFAIINEEYGMWGALLVMFLYLLFMFRAFRIILMSPKAFGALLAVGLSFAFCMQALIHMGVATTLLPVTGLTLPFISKGGSSLFITAIAFGMIMSVSRYVETEEQQNTQEEKT